MAKKTQGMFLGVPRFLWRRYLLPGLILPCFLLLWDILIEPMIPAATDMDLAPTFYMIYAGVTVLLLIGCLVIGLRLFAKFRRFAETVVDNDCQNCLRCAHSLAGLPAEHNCPACGIAYEIEIVVVKWRKATTIHRSALIAAKCLKYLVVLSILVVLTGAVWFYGGMRERRLYEEKWEKGNALADLGAYAEAEQEFLQASAMAERFFGEEDHRVGSSLLKVGFVLAKQGRDSEALPIYQRALTIAEQVFGSDDAEVGPSCFGLAQLYHRQRDYKVAEAFYQRALEVFRNRPGTPQRAIKQLIEPYIKLLRETGRSDEANRLEVDKYYGPEPAGAFVLDVPYIRQGKTPFCTSACLAMMLQHYEIEFNASKLPARISIDPKHGSKTHLMMQYLKELGAEPTLFYPPDVETLLWLVRNGFPVLVAQALSEEERSKVHTVVVVGATDSGDALVIHDPYYGKRVSLDVATFDRRWILGGECCRRVLILSPGRAGLPEGLNPAYVHIAAQFELGRFHAASGDATNAIAAIQETIQMAPDFIPGYLFLAKSFLIADRPNDATDAYRRALEIDETYCWGIAWYYLGIVQWTEGQQAEARLNLTKFLEGDTSGLPEEARQAREALSELEEPTETP